MSDTSQDQPSQLGPTGAGWGPRAIANWGPFGDYGAPGTPVQRSPLGLMHPSLKIIATSMVSHTPYRLREADWR